MPLIPITINVYVGDPIPVPEARVSIWTEEYSECIYDGYTDENGQLTFGLDSGIYNIFLLKKGVSFGVLPKQMEVLSVPLTLTYTGIPMETPPESNGTVYLYGDIKDLNMNPKTQTKVQIYLTNSPQTKNGSLLEKTIIEIYTNETGRWSTLVPSGCLVTVVILNSNFQRTGILPFSGPINVLDLN